MMDRSTDPAAITGVLPLRIQGGRDGHDLGRARNLLRSLQRFAEPGLFAELLIVLPGADVELARQREDWEVDLPLRFVDQSELVPRLAAHGNVGGWTTQQIIKLATAGVASTEFILTLDADVLCTHPIDHANLLPGGRGLLQRQTKEHHRHWWTSSAHLLGVDPRLDEPGISVTPALLSKAVCLGLHEAIESRGRPGTWVDVLLRPHHRLAWQRAVPWYKSRYRWTEYTLYYLYLQANDLFDRYHVLAGTGRNPQLLVSRNSVWLETQFDSWDPSLVFSADDPGLFCVVQSNMAIDPAVVWQRVRDFV